MGEAQNTKRVLGLTLLFLMVLSSFSFPEVHALGDSNAWRFTATDGSSRIKYNNTNVLHGGSTGPTPVRFALEARINFTGATIGTNQALFAVGVTNATIEGAAGWATMRLVRAANSAYQFQYALGDQTPGGQCGGGAYTFAFNDARYHVYRLVYNGTSQVLYAYVDGVLIESGLSVTGCTKSMNLDRFVVYDINATASGSDYRVSVDYVAASFDNNGTQIFYDEFSAVPAGTYANDGDYTGYSVALIGTGSTIGCGVCAGTGFGALVVSGSQNVVRNPSAVKDVFLRGENWAVSGLLRTDGGSPVVSALVRLEIKKNSTGDWLTWDSAVTDDRGQFTSRLASFSDTYIGIQQFRAVYDGDYYYDGAVSAIKEVSVLTSGASFRLRIETTANNYGVNSPVNLFGFLYSLQAGSLAETGVPDVYVSIWVARNVGTNWQEIANSPQLTSSTGKIEVNRLSFATTGVFRFKANVSLPGGITATSSNITVTIVSALDKSSVVDVAPPVTVSDYISKWKSDSQIKGDGAGFFIGMIVMVFANAVLLSRGITSFPLLFVNVLLSLGLVAVEVFPMWVGLLTFLIIAIFAVGPVKKAFGS